MKPVARVWLVLVLLYGSFFYWYTSFGGPLSDEEIARYTAVVSEAMDSPERIRTWTRFMESDTGDDFAMFNAIDLNDTPTPGPGIEPGETSAEVLAKYTRPFLGKAFWSAAHPVLYGYAAGAPMDIWGIEGADDWTDAGVVRYRSRRDLMEQLVAISQAREQVHHFKIAAMEKTIAYPLDPWFQLGDPRLVFAMLLAIVGLGTQLVVTRREG